MKRIISLLLTVVLCFGMFAPGVRGSDSAPDRTDAVRKVYLHTLYEIADKGNDELVAVTVWLKGPSYAQIEAMTPMEKPDGSASAEEQSAYASAVFDTKVSVYSDIVDTFAQKYLDETEQVLQEEYDVGPGFGGYVRKGKIASLAALDEVVWINDFGRSIHRVEELSAEEKITGALHESLDAAREEERFTVRFWLRGDTGQEVEAVTAAGYPTFSSTSEEIEAYFAARQQVSQKMTEDMDYFGYGLFAENRLDSDEVLFRSVRIPVAVATLPKSKIRSLAALHVVTQVDPAFGYEEAFPDPELPEDPAELKKISSTLREFMTVAAHDELIPVYIDLKEPSEEEISAMLPAGSETDQSERNRMQFLLYSSLTTTFVEEHLDGQDEVLYKGGYSSNVIATVPKHKIAGLAALDEVTHIAWALGHDDPVYSEDGDVVCVPARTADEPDKTALTAAIAKAKAIDDLDMYPEESVAVLREMIKEAEYILIRDDVTQETVDAAVEALYNSWPEWSAPVVDTSELEHAVSDAKAIDFDQYTEESAAALREAMSAAEYILASENAAQEEVDMAIRALKKAIAGLEIKDQQFYFHDVLDSEKYYYDAVYWAYNSEPRIVFGMDMNSFGPDNACTRGHVVTFLWRAAGCPEPENAEIPFKDLKKGAFYEKAVAWAVENNITNGLSSDKFGPDATCTRGQIVTFLWRYKGKPASKRTETPFADLKPGGFYLDAVTWAVENEVTNGMTPAAFEPDGTCTRGQVVTFLYRATL